MYDACKDVKKMEDLPVNVAGATNVRVEAHEEVVEARRHTEGLEDDKDEFVSD